MSFYHRPIIPFTLALAAGILVGEVLPGYRVAGWLLAAVCGLLLAVSLFRKKSMVAVPLVLFLSVGYLSIQAWVSPVFPPEHIRYAANGEKSIVTGVVASSPVVSGYRQSFFLEVESLGTGASVQETCGRLRVSLSGKSPEVNTGDRISFVGRLRRIRSFRNPGGFDYERYMAFKGVWVSASVQGESVSIKDRGLPVGLDVWVAPGRKALAAEIDAVTSSDVGGVLKALLLGDRTGLSDSLRQAFQRVGIGHLLAISGLHVGMVAGGAFFLFLKVFGRFPPLLQRAWTRRAAALPALAAVWGYALLAGMSPSTQRAGIMASIFLAALFVGRPQDTLNSLAVAAMAILIVSPPAFFAASFQLSFTAVLAIVLILSLVPAPDMVHPPAGWKKIFRRVAVFLLVSLAAILGTLPLALYYFNEVSLIGLFSNLIFVPAVGSVVLPLGLLSVCIFPASPAVAGLGLKLCALLLTGILWLVRALSAFPLAAVATVTPSVTEMILYYAFLAATGGMIRAILSSRRAAVAYPVKNHRLFRLAAAIAAFAAAGMILDVCYWCHQRFWTKALKVTVLDVGHGSAALVELPGGEVVLIDGGGFSDNSIFDVGKRIVAPLLRRNKIRTVNTLILSHPNSDHLNGLIHIAGHFRVERLISNGESADTRGNDELFSVAGHQGIRTPTYGSMERTWESGSSRIELLYPLPGFLEKQAAEPWRDSNNNSIVVKVTLGKISFLFPGDIMADGEGELVAVAGGRLQSTVLVAPHHGSRTSSSPGFLESVSPEVVVVSSGWDDQYGAPHPEIRERYLELGARVITTAENGAVSFVTDGEELWVGTVVSGEITVHRSLFTHCRPYQL
jgi:competence protein ComEC